MDYHRNAALDQYIERFIEMWDGTVIGAGVKNMYENGTNYEDICTAMCVDIEDFEED